MPTKMEWLVYDPRDRQYICEYEKLRHRCTWSYKEDTALGFATKLEAQQATQDCGFVLSKMVFKARKVK